MEPDERVVHGRDRGRELDQAPQDSSCQSTTAWDRKPEREYQSEEDGRRESEPNPGAPERVGPGVRERDGDGVPAGERRADEECRKRCPLAVAAHARNP